jgi:hypothetical protein
MKIYLEQLATEALGIPDGMMEATDLVWNKMMNIWAGEVEKRMSYGYRMMDRGSTQTIIVPGPIKIGDEEWDAVEIDWDVKTLRQGSPKIDPMSGGGGFSFQSNLSQNFKRIEGANNNIIPLRMTIIANTFNTWEDIYDFVNGPLEKEIYTTLAHELKHAFDHRKGVKSSSSKKGIKAQSRGRYEIAAQPLGIIRPLDSLNYKIYYSHFLENLVRPVQFLAQLQKDKVTKKGFVKALQNSDIYATLQDIKNFSYDELYNNIKTDQYAISKISQYLISKGADIDEYSDDELVNELLNLNFERTIEAMKERYINQAVEDAFERASFFAGMDGLNVGGFINQDKQEAMESVVNDIDRFGDNFEAFYKYEIKKMNILASKSIRKLAKVYDYLPA